jgi:ankyrin repeat protein
MSQSRAIEEPAINSLFNILKQSPPKDEKQSDLLLKEAIIYIHAIQQLEDSRKKIYEELKKLGKEFKLNNIIDVMDEHQETLLTYASKNGHSTIAKYLLEHKANPDLSNKNQQTPLILAVKEGHVSIINDLLEYKANPHVIDCHNDTALNWASANGQLAIVDLLLKHHANPNSVDSMSPLFSAVLKKHLPIVDFLLKHKANPNLVDKNGNLALVQAIQNNELLTVDHLLLHKANPNLSDKKNNTPLNMAIQSNDLLMINCLLEHKADPDFSINGSIKPLYQAYHVRNAKIIERLVEAGAYRGPLGELLNEEASKKLINVEIVKALLEHYDENISNSTKNNLVHHINQYYLNPDQHIEQLDFCSGALREKNSPWEAKKFYKRATERAKNPCIAAYRHLGKLHEQYEDIESALVFYKNGARHGNKLSLKSLVDTAIEWSPFHVESKPSVIPDEKTERHENKEGYLTLTAFIYSILISRKIDADFTINQLLSDLTINQLVFLAEDVLGNSNLDHRHPMQDIHFALRASQKAGEKAEEKATAEEKKEISIITLRAWGLFKQTIDPKHGSREIVKEGEEYVAKDVESDHQQQLEALEQAATQESLDIIAEYLENEERAMTEEDDDIPAFKRYAFK